ASFQSEKYSEFGLSLKMAAFTMPGAIAGGLLAVNIGDEAFKAILGIVMIGVVIAMLIPKNYQKEMIKPKSMWPVYLAMFGIGFYGGFIQVGVGFLLMAALHFLLRVTLVHVNMHKVFIVLVYTVPALLIFIISGNVNWILGLSLAAGNAAGGWIAAKAQVKKGDKIVRYVLIAAIIIMALRLLGVF
ncbi:MAG: sulfite exporter TauE/SafE family protein, partial [Cyclobacteriaceae bacterium]